jgi:Flp pilus assembly pilin Flp
MVRIYAYLTSIALTPTSLRREEGQTLTEYALILAIISVGLIVALTALRNKIEGVFTTLTTTI